MDEPTPPRRRAFKFARSWNECETGAKFAMDDRKGGARVFAAIAAAAALLLFIGCGASERVVIGSKSFSEQVLLGEIIAQHIENRTELKVDRRLNLGGTLLCHQGILSGQLDAYVEYTGTALTAILGMEPVNDREKALELVRNAYRDLGAEWLDPLGFNNTFAILVRAEEARRLGLKIISDAQAHAPGWKPGFGYEFKDRKDGLRGLVETYDLTFGAAPRFMELGLLYPALAEGQIDLAAGNSTDGLIAALDLFILEDDRHYFPPYDAAVVVRKETLARRPQLGPALRELSGTISAERMRRMNYEVDGKGRSVSQVAREFLMELAIDD